MAKINRHIEIVRSTKNGLSSMNEASCDAIFAVLTKHYTEVGIKIVNNLSDFEAVIERQPDLVFLGMKFVPLDDSLSLQDTGKLWISDYLDECGIAYTGSGQKAHELGVN